MSDHQSQVKTDVKSHSLDCKMTLMPKKSLARSLFKFLLTQINNKKQKILHSNGKNFFQMCFPSDDVEAKATEKKREKERIQQNLWCVAFEVYVLCGKTSVAIV